MGRSGGRRPLFFSFLTEFFAESVDNTLLLQLYERLVRPIFAGQSISNDTLSLWPALEYVGRSEPQTEFQHSQKRCQTSEHSQVV
jgi:hypothetical protein